MAFTLTNLPQGSFALNGSGHLYAGGTATWNAQDPTKLESVTGGYELKGFTSGSIQVSGGSVTIEARGVGDGWSQAAPGGRSATMSLTCNRIIGDTCQDGLISMATQGKSDWQTKGVAIAYGIDHKVTQEGSEVTKLKGFVGVWVLTDVSFEQSGGGDNDANAETVTFSFSAFSNLVGVDAVYTPTP